MKAQSLTQLLARVAAVVVAITVVSYIVIEAQKRANPESMQSESTVPTQSASKAETTKSDRRTTHAAVGIRAPDTTDSGVLRTLKPGGAIPVFLPSSKSGIVPLSAGEPNRPRLNFRLPVPRPDPSSATGKPKKAVRAP